MSDSKHRISVKSIQVHAKCDLEGHGAHPTVSIALKSGDTVLGQKDNCTWGMMDWELQPPAEIHAVDEVSLEVTYGLGTPQYKHWALATMTFPDADSLAGDASKDREPLKVEHELATVQIHFTVETPLFERQSSQFQVINAGPTLYAVVGTPRQYFHQHIPEPKRPKPPTPPIDDIDTPKQARRAQTGVLDECEGLTKCI
ncbi:hypothetical protein AB1N83_012183 [Pleurotus pulmonarius]